MPDSRLSGPWRLGPLLRALAAAAMLPAAARAFDPAEFGTVTLHLKADDLVQADNSPVAAWGPLTASGSQMPIYIASDARFNGMPVVMFDGSSDVMKIAGANYAARTILVVTCLENGASNLSGLLSNGNDGLNLRREGVASFYRSPGHGMDGNDFTGHGSPTGTLDVNRVASGSFVPGSPHLVKAVAGATKTYGDFWVGSASTSLGRYWFGSVAEIIVYSSELSPEGLQRVGWYLQDKYDLPTDFTPPYPTIDFHAATASIQSDKGVLSTPGAPVTLSWSVGNADTLSIDQGVQGSTSQSSGSAVVSPSVTTTYTLSAANEDVASTKSLTIYIGEAIQPAVLNEFLASNSGGLEDEDGDSSDWIEIRNPNPFAIDLSGYRLEDSANTWDFPAGALIEGDGYRIVFASSKNRINPAANLHTGFGLSADGEYLALKTAGGLLATEFSPGYPVQNQNISAGLAGGVAVFYPVPTPGEANGSPVSGVTEEVEFSTPRGFYSAAFLLTLSCPTPDSVIRYTTDASTPTESNGTLYSGQFVVNSTKTLRARAFRTGYMPSRTGTRTYLFLDDVLANQGYPAGTAPAGWPSSSVNGQQFRYGWNSALKSQYTDQQLRDGLEQIPTVSLVTDQANLTGAANGIYVNAANKGDAWERPVSVEYMPADGSDGFRIDAGLRIRGGASRGDGSVKHSLRLHFRGSYGESSLKFALHGGSGTDEFDTLDLRTEQNYHWANNSGTENTAVREVFCRDLMDVMGQPTTRSRYVQLYLNGQYWGIYQTEERAQEDYGASYFGGQADDYDVIQTSNHPNFTYELSSGEINSWQAMWNLARTHAGNPTAANYFALMGCNPDGQRNPALPVYVDLDNLITYMLVTYYTGDGDAPLSNFLGMNAANNWRGMRNRTGTEGFRYFVHDSEHTLQAPSWVDNRANTSAPNGGNRGNFTYSNPEWIHEDLAANPEYRLRFADIVQKHLFNGGAMTPAAAQALFDARAAQISQAIMPDAARWGTSTENHTVTQWQSRLNTIRNSFFPTRSSTLISQLRSRGFFPVINVPVFSQRGGSVGDNFTLTMTASESIYYTLDGSDPRAVGGGIAGSAYTAAGIPVEGVVTVRARARSSGGEWSALDEARFIAHPPAAPGDLVISKIHYHPDNPNEDEEAQGFESDTEFEYVELLNISDHTVDLSAVEFKAGIGFNFANSPIAVLAPGERVLVARNPAALQFRYGPGLPVAGQYTDDLSNGGETLRLAGTGDSTLKQFAYDDASPWPTSPDGDGFALILKSPSTDPAAGLGGNWRASNLPGGRPGAPDTLDPATWRAQQFASEDLADPEKEATLWGDDADPDGDGMVNLIEMVTATSPLDPSSRFTPVLAWVTDTETQERHLTLTCRVREDLTGLTISARASADLETWPDLLPAAGPAVSQGDGTALVIFQDPVPFGAGQATKRFVRVVVTAP